YQSKAAIPTPIQALFRENVEGITRWCRFIAVTTENKSDEEIADTVSHELAHAYISASLGLSSNKLPRWFHEGVAQYLSDAKDRYVSQTSFGIERIGWSPNDYEEFSLVFRYLDATLGTQGVAEFIRHAVEQRSADEPLRDAIGTSSYDELRNCALQWQ